MNENRKQAKAVIGCDAAGCEYNEHGSVCRAESIRVGGKNARCTNETSCSTFKSRDGARR